MSAKDAEVEVLIEDLNDLAVGIQSRLGRQEIEQTEDLLRAAGERGLLDTNVRRLTLTDAVER